jgi:hypothetical protein
LLTDADCREGFAKFGRECFFGLRAIWQVGGRVAGLKVAPALECPFWGGCDADQLWVTDDSAAPDAVSPDFFVEP